MGGGGLRGHAAAASVRGEAGEAVVVEHGVVGAGRRHARPALAPHPRHAVHAAVVRPG